MRVLAAILVVIYIAQLLRGGGVEILFTSSLLAMLTSTLKYTVWVNRLFIEVGCIFARLHFLFTNNTHLGW
jgi:hypothetical protein